MTTRVSVAALVLAASVALAAQQPATRGATIAGIVVVDDASARPVHGSVVALSGATLRVDRMTITDEAGKFSFTDLEPGRYTMSASKAAYVTTHHGSKRPGQGPGTPIVVQAGQQITGMAVRITRGAVIAGTTLDQLNRPRQDITVTLLSARVSAGKRTLTPIATQRSNDLGAYRFFGLAPGSYVVAAFPFLTYVNGASLPTEADFEAALHGLTPPAGSPALVRYPVGYAPTFFGQSLDATQATAIALSAGEERTGADIAFRLFPTAAVSGTVRMPDGGVPRGLQLAIVRGGRTARITQGAIDESIGNVSSVSTQDGRFSLGALTPGRYALVARAADAGTTPPVAGSDLNLWSIAEFEANGQNVSNLDLTLETGMTLSGRIVFERLRQTAPLDASGVQLRLVPIGANGVNLGVPPVRADADGTFTFRGIAPGRYRISTTVGTGRAALDWTLKSATLEHQDTVDDGIPISAGQNVAGVVATLSDRMASISGTLVDALGAPTPEYFVVVFPADAQLRSSPRRIRQVHPATDGAFSITGLPSGAYLIAAVTDLDPDDLADPAFLDTVAAAAVAVRLQDGDTNIQHLKIASAGKQL